MTYYQNQHKFHFLRTDLRLTDKYKEETFTEIRNKEILYTCVFVIVEKFLMSSKLVYTF